MAKILIAYGTTEGHTRKIAQYMAQVARAQGHKVIIADGNRIEPGAVMHDQCRRVGMF